MNRKIMTLSLDVYDRRIHEGAARYIRASAPDINLVRTSAMPWNKRDYDHSIQGAIVLARLHEHLRPLRALLKTIPYPVVLLGTEGNTLAFRKVLEGDYEAGKAAAEYYLQCKFRRFAAACQGVDAGYSQRLRGFEETLAKHGYAVRRIIYHDYYHKEARGGPRLTWDAYLLQHMRNAEKPLALFALDDEVGGSVLRYCDEAGVRVPEEVAVLGVGNDHMICDYARTPLSSIDMNHEHLGWKAAELLHALMDGRAAPADPLVIPPLGVVERRSTEILASDNPHAMLGIRYLWDHLHEPLRAGDIARAVGISRTQLDRVFLDSFGRTVKGELIRMRMQRVRELLASTDLPANAIAYTVGFRTPEHMYRIFLRENKMTVKQFRARLNAEAPAPWEPSPVTARLVPRAPAEP